MSPSGIHHLGVAVADLDEAVDSYRRMFGAELEERLTVPEGDLEVAMLRIGGDRIELLHSLDPETPVGRFLERRGPGMHHVAFEVDDVGAELDRLAAVGAELIDVEPRAGAFGHDIGFVHPGSAGGVLTELVARG
ncbi:MAG TPA: methylmalonyl-CoA epimerase [Gaiellaceae bacterium]|nr:methylmalonyl-CoA epimerase [Gaiellaceae bacterium]